MHPNNPRKPYYVVVTRCGEGTHPFCWEIHRRRQAMGVKVSGSGYRSHRAAQEAGSEALNRFLSDLSRESEECSR
jgi:hypothetical protein